MKQSSFSSADLHLLRVFSAVVEAQGFSAAQITLNVAPSTISRQISALEVRLGMRLCQRGRKGFRLTENGEVVYAATKTLFAALAQFDETVDGTRGKLVGSLSLAAVDNWIFNQQAPILGALSKFVQMAPDVTLELHSMAPDDIEIAVQDEHISFGLGVFHKHKPGLSYDLLSSETIGLYCGKQHLLASATSPKEIDALLQISNFSKRAYLNEDIVAPLTRSLRSNARAHQIEGIAMLILTGKYIGYLPESFANIWVREGRMVSVGAGRYDLKTDIKLVQKRNKDLNLVARTFIRLINETTVKN